MKNEPLPITPNQLFPFPSRCAGHTVLQPAAIAGTPYGTAAFAGASVIGFDTIEDGVARLRETPGLSYLYWDAMARFRDLDYTAMLDNGAGAMKPGFASDGVHPTLAGYTAMEPVATCA